MPIEGITIYKLNVKASLAKASRKTFLENVKGSMLM